jgi:L-alanine-DL-glutamate epimerase-like enolase superfamily enzyme
MDMAWCGGVSEARKIGIMAQTYKVPVAFHDCTGPVVLTTSTHMALHMPNCFVQEIVRAFYYGWYGDVVTNLPPVTNGQITVPQGPGLGIELNPDVFKRADCHRRVTTQKDL